MQKHTSNLAFSTNIIKDVQVAKYHPRINNDSQHNFDVTMNNIFMMLGITGNNLPSREVRQVMREHMMSTNFNYSNLDLKCAFTLYVQGKLDFTENHYQNLSIFFIEKVMQSYKRYSVALKNEEQRNDPMRPTLKEYHKIMVDGCIWLFEDYKKNARIFDFGNSTYDYLEKLGHLTFTEDRKEMAMARARQMMKAEHLNKKCSGLTKDPTTIIFEAIESNAFDLVTAKAKRVLLQEYFDGLIEMEIDLMEILTN